MQNVHKIVDKSGKMQFGIYHQAFKSNNVFEAKNAFGKILPASFLKFRTKEWQAFQVDNDSYFVFIVVYNAKIYGLAQCIIYRKNTGERWVYEKQTLPWQIKTTDNLLRSTAAYLGAQFSIVIRNNLDNGHIDIQINHKATRKLPALAINLEADFTGQQPMNVILPFAQNRGMYSFKSITRVSGKMQIATETELFMPQNSFIIVDDHKGTYPYAMKYNWVTAAGFDSKGQLSGFNLTQNQAKNPEINNENGIWINGKLFSLPYVQFKRQDDIMKPWHVFDANGVVDLKFTPRINNSIRINLGLLRAIYDGPFGVFEGKITTDRGIIKISDWFGMGEKKIIYA